MAVKHRFRPPTRALLQDLVDEVASGNGLFHAPVYEPTTAADNTLRQDRAVHALRNRNYLGSEVNLQVDQDSIKEKETHDGEYCVTETAEDYSNEKPMLMSTAYNGLLNPYIKLVHRVESCGPLNCVKGKMIRTIPNYERLSCRNDELLSPIIYRVIHSSSGGCVQTCPAGLIRFESQALKTTGSPTNFSLFSMSDIRDGLLGHVYNRKNHGSSPFNSHWISTTQSFVEAYSLASMYKERGYMNVKI